MNQRREYLLSVAALASLSALAGCAGSEQTPDQGDTGDGGVGTDTAPPASPPGTAAADNDSTGEGTSAREAYPDYNWAILDDEEPEPATTVLMGKFTYDPIIARVPAGTEIEFPNQDAVAHTVTIPALDIDDDADGGESLTLVIDEPGTYEYVCRLHPPDMLGRLVVEEGLAVDEDSGRDTIGSDSDGETTDRDSDSETSDSDSETTDGATTEGTATPPGGSY